MFLLFLSPYKRYVDLTEAIDANDASFMDNTEFQEADAIPLHEALPTKHYLDSEVNYQNSFVCILSEILIDVHDAARLTFCCFLNDFLFAFLF